MIGVALILAPFLHRSKLRQRKRSKRPHSLSLHRRLHRAHRTPVTLIQTVIPTLPASTITALIHLGLEATTATPRAKVLRGPQGTLVALHILPIQLQMDVLLHIQACLLGVIHPARVMEATLHPLIADQTATQAMEAIRLRLTLLHKDPDGPNTPRVTGRPQPMEDLRLPAQLHLGTITGRDTRLMVQGLGSRRLRLLLQRPGRRRPLLRLALVHLLRHRVDLRQDLALIRVLMGSRHITISISSLSPQYPRQLEDRQRQLHMHHQAPQVHRVGHQISPLPCRQWHPVAQGPTVCQVLHPQELKGLPYHLLV